MNLQAFLTGVAVTAFIYWVGGHVSSYIEYVKFKRWLVKMNIDLDDLDSKSLDKFYAMYEISKLPNVTIEEVEKKPEK